MCDKAFLGGADKKALSLIVILPSVLQRVYACASPEFSFSHILVH